ncbi:MAG: hypothetical protein ACI9F9_000115 [Candidatus Paceibacteria bacterium]|jgi:hypothetical protein
MKNYLLNLFLAAIVLGASASAGIGTAFCFGVGCPCANDDPLAGCANSTGSGAYLEALGSESISADLLSFHATNVPQNKVGLLVMGSSAISVPFKDGLRCFGTSIQRFWKHENSGQSGTLTYENVISQWGKVSNVFFTPGDTRYFQVWHRDTGNGSPCNTKANLTSGVELTFTP